MRQGKFFAAIVYYLFTFTIGVLLTLFLPYILMSDGENLNIMRDSFKKGNYDDAMLLVGGYFDKRPVFQEEFKGGGGIVLFSAATLVFTDGKDENAVDEAKIHASYAGFVYGAKDSYSVFAKADNRTEMRVNVGDEVKSVKILDSDSDGDGVKDTIATLASHGFFFLEFDKDTYPSLNGLTFIDKDGNEFAKANLQLGFEEQFFTDVQDFIDEYNSDYKSAMLPSLHEKFLAKNENYTQSSLGVAKSSADAKAAVIVVAYFVTVYVVGDFLLGWRLIARFAGWFLYKVCKVKPKTRKRKNDAVFGTDYYCQVTLELDVTGADGFDGNVRISYTDSKGEELSFSLMKGEGYKATRRVKAGEYVNMWIDINKTEYATENLPETLIVEGYRKAFKIKILKREEKTR